MNSLRRVIENLKSKHEDTPDEQYRQYLIEHIDRVSEVYYSVMKPILVEEGIDSSTLDRISYLILHHDESKYDSIEFKAYRDHFYDPDNNPRSGNVKYDYAWNHHQKHNPHHWNYWVLINDVDEPQVQALDMPFEYIIELLCDWQSAGKHYGNSAKEWYEKNGHKMILSDKTRATIEKYIDYLT